MACLVSLKRIRCLVVIFDTLSTRVDKDLNLGFETGIISLSTCLSYRYTNDALTVDRNGLMQVRYQGQFRKQGSTFLLIYLVEIMMSNCPKTPSKTALCNAEHIFLF